ncbi:SDR family NAD(P)-dependent oxidoreductase [Nonomuraea rhodomycinica]|uniref:SDR family NAD(P)-dependent oxidoreductase n=1 Tax=Nonomuraea rhodomycinica TaxID=1712872 RepID=A0A7Y6IYU5_9ACTN|nr:SDR family NAD(P)-dependent oxidoreductase [Nonomuraea rhodomycinica]NUW46947.1 SDR family NAD(P)-dependent oxidoreductase [Nonomuraea rhodomycinica]
MGESLRVVVTGGNRGIGRAVAAEAVRRGHRVTILARRPDEGSAAAREIGARLVVGDLSCVRTAWHAAGEIAATVPAIDVLVHNAALWPSRRVLNEDGFEQAFFTNHLAPFLLNHLLEDRLRRVVQVSAGLYVTGKVDPARTPTGEDFHPVKTYATTKLANLLMLPLFAERWREAGVTIDAVHPGVLRTGLGDRGGALGLVLKLVKRTWKPAEHAAPPVADLLAARGTGRYFEESEQVPLRPPALDATLARRLWNDAAQALDVA